MTILDLPNGRDLGGLPGAGGTIRPGLLLRSAAPTGAAAGSALAALGVRRVVDLRTDLEREQQPTEVPAGAQRHNADVLADASYAGAANLGRLAAEALGGHQVADGFAGRDLRAVMLDSYRDFTGLGSGRRAAADVIRLLAQDDAGPVLLHCTAGKDRTGWLVALVLHCLGTPWEAVMADYLASGPAVLGMFDGFLRRLPDPAGAADVLAPVLGVDPEYLAAARQEAETEFGSLEAYVRQGLGIEDDVLALLRARLLQPSSASALR